jgi:spore maturation protein CgeB
MRQAINNAFLENEIENLKQSFSFDPKEIKNHKKLKEVLKRKHLGLTRASINFGMDIRNFSLIINGHGYTVWIIQSIQTDLGLSNKQVLQLWPQLKEWPREPYSRARQKRRKLTKVKTHNYASPQASQRS